MVTHEAHTASRDEASSTDQIPARSADSALAALPGGLAPSNALWLQRAAGNRAVARLASGARLLGRDVANTIDAKRGMRETPDKKANPSYKGDVEDSGNAGALWVYDPFDRTLTIFTDETSQAMGIAIRVTFDENTAVDVPKLRAENDLTKATGIIHAELLSPVRAKALRWLKGEGGKYQEDEAGRKARIAASVVNWKKARKDWADALPKGKTEDQLTQAERDARTKRQADVAAFDPTIDTWATAIAGGAKTTAPVATTGPQIAKLTKCNDFVGLYSKAVLGTYLGDMDPRQQAINLDRAGAFRTMYSDPFKAGHLRVGPQAGDIISYGAVKPATKQGGLRVGDFLTVKHVGVLKSRRVGSDSGTEIWTVVDGGQGGFESLQEVNERVRRFSVEKLTTPKGDLECGVFKGKPNDYLLRGWVDIDAFAGGTSEALPAGAAHALFGKVAKTKKK